MARRIAIVGAGWAGLAAAVELCARGDAVLLYEAARVPGGRARSIGPHAPWGTLDNGQHILIGAYTETLALMRRVGVDPGAVLHRMPLTLLYPDGGGVRLPDLPAPWNVVWGVLRARGWRWRDRAALLRAAVRWQAQGFRCHAQLTVQQLIGHLPRRVRDELLEPLCVSALNTPGAQASAQVFLTVMRDALLGARGSSDALIPKRDLGAVLPEAAVAWLRLRGAQVRLGQRVTMLRPASRGPGASEWEVNDEPCDAVVLACPPWEAARLVQSACSQDTDNGNDSGLDRPGAAALRAWAQQAAALQHEAIATVYAHGGPALPVPMWALRSSADQPAQFVFDRAQLGGPPGLKAFVVSASVGDSETLTRQVLQQASGLGWHDLVPVRTVIEKRAGFVCTPGLQRPPASIARGLWACGDYVDGPYPATLEGAVRSGMAVAAALHAR